LTILCSIAAPLLGTTYRKDAIPDELVKIVERLKFNIPTIAPFDVELG